MELPVYNIHQLIEPSAGITVIDNPDTGHLDIGDTRILWSTSDITISNTTVINLPMSFLNDSYNIQATVISDHIGADIATTPLSTSSFEVRGTQYNVTFRWFAIGQKNISLTP